MNLENVPEKIASALEPDEPLEAVFNMGGGLEIYATDRRFFGKRGDHQIDIKYAEVKEARRRASYWKTWRGIARIVIGVGFLGAGALTGFETPIAAILSGLLFLFGTVFILLGIYRREDWVEMKVSRREPSPSFWYVVTFLPFYLMLQSRKRYRVPGEPEQVDAFFKFLRQRVPSDPIVVK